MESGYFATSWSDIKNSPGWFGKVCLLGLISFIPVFGSMVQYGYSYAWARDIAWDIHRPMPERIFGNEDGKLYSRGVSIWLLFLVASMVAAAVGAFLGDSAFSSLAVAALSIFLSVFATVGAMRTAIYGRLSAGFQVKKIWAMMSHDANGLLRIVGMVLLISLIVGVVFGVIVTMLIFLLAFIGIAGVGSNVDLQALSYSLSYGDAGSYSQLSSLLAALAPVIGVGMIFFVALFYVISCFSAWINLLMARAMGYWVRQFDVANWRGQDDPMPFEVNGQNAVAAVAAPVAQPMPTAGPVSSQSNEVPAESSGDSTDDPLNSGQQANRVTVVCPSCGRTVDGENARFCVQCGAKLEVDDSASTQE